MGAVLRVTLHHARTCDQESPDGDEEIWQTAMGYLSVSKMLYGLAVETALKGHLLRERPSRTELHLRTDGRGRAIKVELKQIGVPMGQGHDLVRLAETAGAFARENMAALSQDRDFEIVRDILAHLTESIMWSGRYPVPKRSGSKFIPSPDTPLVAFWHYIRDWLDPFLDHYQSVSDPSFRQLEVLNRLAEIMREEKSKDPRE